MTEAKIALVTGANRGIGFEILKSLVIAGYTVIGTSRSKEGTDVIDKELAASNAKGFGSILDIKDKDSIKELNTEIKEKMLFWLDGHNFYDVPLIEELEQIKTIDRNDHIILIDDVRMMDTDGWNLLKKSDIIDKIMEINSGYSISYIDNTMAEKDIMVASV